MKKKNKRAKQQKSKNASLALTPAIVFGFALLVFSFALRITITPLLGGSFIQAKQIASHISVTPSLKSPTPTPKPKSQVLGLAKAQAAELAPDYCINAPILFYHHVEPMADAERLGHPQFTVDATIFSEQLDYLKENGYKTVSLEEVVDAIRNHKEFSNKSIVLTFDDGYVDAYTYALPILRQHSMIGSFMIPTGLITNPDYMNWDQLRDLASSMPVYNHTWSHANLPGDNPSKQEFEITKAQQELKDKLGNTTNIFTYPYGAFNNDVITLLEHHGYIAAISTLPGTQQCESFIMALHRTRIGNAPLSSYGL